MRTTTRWLQDQGWRNEVRDEALIGVDRHGGAVRRRLGRVGPLIMKSALLHFLLHFRLSAANPRNQTLWTGKANFQRLGRHDPQSFATTWNPAFPNPHFDM